MTQGLGLTPGAAGGELMAQPETLRYQTYLTYPSSDTYQLFSGWLSSFTTSPGGRSTLLGTWSSSQNRNDRLHFFWSGDLAICDLAIS